LQSGELSQAEIHFSKALQLAPDLQGARIGLASTYLRLYQPAKALAAIQPALTEGGVDGQALSLAGEAALALGDTPAAEMYFQRAAKLMPGDAAARTSLALTHMARGDTNKAFDELSRVASDTKDIVAEQAMYSARLRRGEFDAAMEAVDIIAKKQPSNANVHDLRGKIYLMKRDYLQARKAFETQLTQDPKSISASANLAAIDLIEKKPDEARKRLRAAIKSDPKNIYPMLALARLQLESGAPLEEIRQIYTDAILAQPGAREPRLELLSLTLRKRLYKEALTVAQEAAAALPSDSLVMDAVGRAQMEAGDVEQAITTFRRIAGSDTKSALPYTRLADIYLKTGKREQAEGALRKALEAEPDLIQAQVALIDLLVQGKRTSEALNLARQRQRDAPDKPAGYALEAALHVALKEMDQALASYQSGVAKTQSPPLALALHQLLTHLHRYDRADQFAAVWQRDHPKDLRFSFQVAESAISRGQLEDAYTRLTRLAQESPDDALVLNNLAAVMVQSGKSGALPIAQKAADLATGNIRILVLDTLASAFAQNGQLDKALATQKQALELAPEASNLRLGLARLALKGGDKALARQELTRLKALGAKFSQQEEVTRLLGSL
jgi:putative PEP-CTERM system TPR-repeat lipoprotein